MEKKVLFQRIKGLLALVLAFTMMFGTGMMVLADEAKIDFSKIKVGDNIPGGTTLYYSYTDSGDVYVYIYMMMKRRIKLKRITTTGRNLLGRSRIIVLRL